MYLFTLLQAAGAAQRPAGGGASFWIMILLMFAVMYFFMIRPQRKQQKELEKFRNELKKGDKVVTAGGLRILGLGGSMRYKPDSPHMYTEPEMRRRIWRMGFSLRRSRGIDLLVTHAPALGYGDMEDLPHQGFACFNDLLMAHQPALMAFGHVHQDYGHFRRTLDHPSGARLLNAWQSFVLDTEEL